MAEKEKKQEKTTRKEFSIPLRKAKAKGKPDIEKAKRAIALLYKFFQKHYRKGRDKVIISNEVNQEIWKNSNNIKNRIQVQAIEKEGKVFAYLKESGELKKLEEEKKKTQEKKQKPVEEKKEKTAEKKETKKESAEKQEAVKKPGEESPKEEKTASSGKHQEQKSQVEKTN